MDNDDKLAVGIAILELILKYGVPGAMALIKGLQTNNPTSGDIRALADRAPHPDSYEAGGTS